MKRNELAPLIDTLPDVQPEVLAQRATDAVREILAEAASANTTRSYTSALRYWAGWYQIRYGRALSLPVPEPAVVQFIVDHLARRTRSGSAWELPTEADAALVASGLKQRPGPWKLATVIHRVAVLSTAHRARHAEGRQGFVRKTAESALTP